MIFLYSQWPKHAYQFGGGGKSKPAQQIEAAPVPMPAPPVTQNDQSVVMAEHDLARQALGKKSVKKTIFAGDTGGFQGAGAPGSPAPKGKY